MQEQEAQCVGMKRATTQTTVAASSRHFLQLTKVFFPLSSHRRRLLSVYFAVVAMGHWKHGSKSLAREAEQHPESLFSDRVLTHLMFTVGFSGGGWEKKNHRWRIQGAPRLELGTS